MQLTEAEIQTLNEIKAGLKQHNDELAGIEKKDAVQKTVMVVNTMLFQLVGFFVDDPDILEVFNRNMSGQRLNTPDSNRLEKAFDQMEAVFKAAENRE